MAGKGNFLNRGYTPIKGLKKMTNEQLQALAAEARDAKAKVKKDIIKRFDSELGALREKLNG
jgi:hypothetical protein